MVTDTLAKGFGIRLIRTDPPESVDCSRLSGSREIPNRRERPSVIPEAVLGVRRAKRL
jgi:hypothetical protein